MMRSLLLMLCVAWLNAILSPSPSCAENFSPPLLYLAPETALRAATHAPDLTFPAEAQPVEKLTTPRLAGRAGLT